MIASVRVKPRSSWRLLVALGCVHGGALACLLSLSLPIGLELGLAVLVVGSLVRHGLEHSLRVSATSICEATIDQALRVDLRTRDGREHRGVGLGSVFVHPSMVVLRFRSPRLTLFLLPDMIDRDEHRKLCALVREARKSSVG